MIFISLKRIPYQVTLFILILLSSFKVLGSPLKLNLKHCSKNLSTQETKTNTQYLDQEITATNISKVYTSFYNGERSSNRIHMNSLGQFITYHKNQTVLIPDNFLANLVGQIQSALDQGFGEYLFFPDFGHGHLQAPKNIEPNSIEYFFSDNDFAVLFHSVETYSGASSFKKDNRNFFAYSNTSEVSSIKPIKSNTVFNVPGYSNGPFGFYMKGNTDGCFIVKINGQDHFFDIKI